MFSGSSDGVRFEVGFEAGAGVLPVVLIWIFSGSARKRELSFTARVAAAVLLLTLLVYGITYAILPKTNVVSGGSEMAPRIFDYMKRRERAMDVLILSEKHDGFRGMSKDEIAKLLDDFFRSKHTTNQYTGEPVKEEDSPGNYTFVEDDRGVVWRTYSAEGYPDDCVVVSRQQD